ncbi:hypothetical protein CBS101457_005069 [Exobasidium rhododendri]|nr:hypothetical protein CBS101457_005069 [Exobasidium rhododendri]
MDVSKGDPQSDSITSRQGDVLKMVVMKSPPAELVVTPLEDAEESDSSTPKSAQFWLAFVTLCTVTMLSALEMSCVGTVLPTISQDLDVQNLFVWMITAYLIAEAAMIPLFGQLANIFGRKATLLIAVGLFSIGSGVSGGANSAAMLIGGRAVQGVGGGGITTLVQIIVSDLVSLRERGKYMGLLGMVMSIGTVIGPIVGGAFASAGAWRWVFYLNLPFCGIALVVIPLFLRIQTPNVSVKDGLARIDFLGCLYFVGSVISLGIGLAWGGTRHPWGNANVITPLVLGILRLGLFIAWESSSYCNEPMVSPEVFMNRTSAAAFALVFIHGVVMFGVIYYLPVHFQAVVGQTALKSGVSSLPFTLVCAPFAVVAGVSIAVTGRYRVPIYVAFILLPLGTGLLSLLDKHSSIGEWVVFELICGAGAGLLFSACLSPIQASLDVELLAAATAMYTFKRSFGSIWGLAIPSAVFNSSINTSIQSLALSNPLIFQQLANGRAYSASESHFWHTLSPALQEQIESHLLQAYHLETKLDTKHGLQGKTSAGVKA